jgi:hypothetical protein
VVVQGIARGRPETARQVVDEAMSLGYGGIIPSGKVLLYELEEMESVLVSWSESLLLIGAEVEMEHG